MAGMNGRRLVCVLSDVEALANGERRKEVDLKRRRKREAEYVNRGWFLLLLKLIEELRCSQWRITDFRRSAGEQRPPKHSYKYPLLVKGHLLPEVFIHCSPKTSVHHMDCSTDT